MTSRTLTVPADLTTLGNVTEFVESILVNCPSQLRSQIVLAIHELCLNIVEHAYAGATGEIELNADDENGILNVVVRDYAPNAYTEGEITAPNPLDFPEGGWGLYILHQVMDKVEYRRLAAGNQWHLVKHLR
jgi:anti-sigma regulatory factor (Ser/Thr protein kinase)